MSLVAFIDGPHVQLAIDVVRTLREAFDHVTAFVEEDPTGDASVHFNEPLNVLLLASQRPLRHTPPAFDEPLEPGSMDELFSKFVSWRPPRLQAAANAQEGTILAGPDEWAKLGAEAAAAGRGMREQQEALLPARGWSAVRALLEEAGETPPRRIGIAPSSTMGPGRQGIEGSAENGEPDEAARPRGAGARRRNHLAVPDRDEL